jgi:ribosomal protein S18 acetylase RimI-like enzyme
MTEVRAARAEDDEQLVRIDAATWTAAVSPAPAPPAGTPFFDERRRPADVLVVEVDGSVAGYAKLGQQIPLPSHEHVLEIDGLAVDPAHHRSGVGRRLVEAATEEARRRGARKLSLRVLGPNTAARRLYEGCGFSVEGILHAEFLLDGQYVDDVLMARDLRVVP